MGGKHVGESSELYDILVRVARGGQHEGWDAKIALTAEERGVLRKHQRLWSQERNFAMQGLRERTQYFVVADASLENCAHVIFNANDVLACRCRRPARPATVGPQLGGKFAHHQIFFLELIAAVAGVGDVEEAKGGPANIVVLSDNLAVVQVINQEWSRDEFARKMLARMRSNGSVVRAIWIPTEKNPVDGLTRREKGNVLGNVDYVLEVMHKSESVINFCRITEV
jgi:hypothetical protein